MPLFTGDAATFANQWLAATRAGDALFDERKDPASLVGSSYWVQSVEEPEGFAGPNDQWHGHAGVCLKGAADGGTDALGSDGSISEADCTSQGGTFLADINVSLLHVWTVPGYTSPIGVFSHVNPNVTCDDGTYHYEKGSACTLK